GAGVHIAAQRVRDMILKISAHQRGVHPADLEITNGVIGVRGMPLEAEDIAGGKLETAEFAAHHHHARTVSFKDIAYSANTGHDMPEGLEPGLHESAFFDPVNFTYPFGVHIPALDVDAETGETPITRYIPVDDCGDGIAPMSVPD